MLCFHPFNVIETLTLVSWNVCGLGHPIKQGKIFAHLKSLKADIVFLQETHKGLNRENSRLIGSLRLIIHLLPLKLEEQQFFFANLFSIQCNRS